MQDHQAPEYIDFSLKGVAIPIVREHGQVMSRITKAFDGKLTGQYITAINPEKIYRATKDSKLREVLEKSLVNYADGIGIVLAAKLLSKRGIERITGIDLFQEILKTLSARNGSLFLFGATEDVNKLCFEVIAQKHPNLRMVGRCNGYDFTSEELVQKINSVSPDMVVVALGSPAQELWIDEHAAQLRTHLLMGVGGSFDVISGRVRRAPRFLRKIGFEWAYRLISTPARSKRHLKLLLFLKLVLGEWLRKRH